jgi:uncharacterized repeat protein (TIGR03803 family)
MLGFPSRSKQKVSLHATAPSLYFGRGRAMRRRTFEVASPFCFLEGSKMGTLARLVLGIGAAALLLTACGGSQPPIGAQASAITSARIAGHHPSGSYQQLYRFHPPKDGVHPDAGLLDVGGTLYGTTSRGGLSQKGTIYGISTGGVDKVLHRFRGGSDGSDPQSGLIDVNGTLYGTTEWGGSHGNGTVYSVSTSGSESVLYAFKGGSDGTNPEAGLIDVNGTLYGTTRAGGAYNDGTVFSVTTSGQETVLHSFAYGSDGAAPLAELIDVHGTLYGTTGSGGSRGCGTVYSITPKGVEKVLYAFQCGSDGWEPLSGLIDVNGTLYGTTSLGGIRYSPCGDGDGCGMVYSMSTTGTKNVVYLFTGPDGESPQADLIDVNGVLYGTTTDGGEHGVGTVFSLTTEGVETVLYSFSGTTTDGYLPVAPLTDVNGTLYGTTQDGGNHNVCCRIYGYGTVFGLSP